MTAVRDHVTQLAVLLVEDNPGDALLTAEALDAARIAVDLTVAEDGGQALQFLHDARALATRRLPDLILLDINLPGMSGLDVLDQIRTDHVLGQIPVIVLSGSSAPSDVLASYRGHAFRFLSKPVALDQLAEAVRALESHWLPTRQHRRPTTLSVILVEDNDADAHAIEELLADAPPPPFDPIAILRARSRAEMVQLLRRAPDTDCVLIDLSLPDARGTEAVVEAGAIAPQAAVVMLTGSLDPEMARATLLAGAQDHLVKGPDLTEEVARRAIRYAIDRAAQTQALRASRQELSEFAHRVAHDLKSPMAVVVSLLDVLRRRDSDPDDIALHEVATRTSHRLVEMVDRLLEYAETAGTEDSLGRVELDPVVDWVRATLDGALPDHALRVPEPLPAVRANEIGLRHVFLNLISNSTKYAVPGVPPEIVIRGARRGDRVQVEVMDNGRGIDPEHREQVFRAGFRVLVDQPGTGLGLATVQRIMNMVGGHVSAGPRQTGPGTVMRLEFPAGD